MGRLLMRMGLPLLTKELLEQAARRRTWVLRSAYLGMLFLIFLMNAAQYWDRSNFRSMLGRGGDLFEFLMWFQFFGVYLLVPLTSFGLITSEKERDSLQLLLLTRLTPATILVEKLLSRMVPLALFLLASLPLLAIAYSYGGVSTPMLANAVLCLICTSFFLASIALLVSTLASTSTQAFFMTLLTGAVIIIGPPILNEILDEITNLEFHDLPFIGRDAVFLFMGPYVFYENANNSFTECLAWNIPQLAMGVACLIVARLCLPLVSASGKATVARKAKALVDRTVGMVVPKSGHHDLPDWNPITWLELRHGMLSRPLYLTLFFGLVASFLFVGSLIAASERDLHEFSGFSHAILWLVAPLMICGRAAGLFGTERARQTLDVLLTTPLKTSDILRQKMSGVWWLIGMLLMVFVIIAIMSTCAAAIRNRNTQPLPLAFFASIITAAIYLPMLAWMSIAVSLKTKTAARATIYSVITLVVWCLGPGFFCVMCMVITDGAGIGNEEGFFAIVFPVLSPAFLPMMNVIAFFDDDPLEEMYIVATFWNCIIYGTALGILRWYCMENASEALDRVDR